MLLENKVAIITGASRGIGRQAAITLAKHGASIIITGRNVDLLNEIASIVDDMGRKCIICSGDVRDEGTARYVTDTAIKQFGKMDILVNNAGINMRTSTLDMSMEQWKEVIDINLHGNLLFTKAVLSYMVEQKSGKIVNVSSTTAKSGHRNAIPAYGASKAGVDYLTKHLALEMAPYDINVNGVSPGPIDTDMIKQWSSEHYERVLANIPLNRIGTPQNVADAILFLSSSMSDFITGETININGGTYLN